MNPDVIGFQKAILWEQAKGFLRAMAAAGGQIASTDVRSPDWRQVSKVIEAFITDFENEGFHE